jgi:hypothetical protein
LTQKVPLLCFEWAAELDDVSTKCLDYLQTLQFTKFYIQNEDEYTFRPREEDYYSIDVIKQKLKTMENKKDWGMIWCK